MTFILSYVGEPLKRSVGCLMENYVDMSLSAETRHALITALLGQGWFWESDFIYAPNRTLWLHGSELWHGTLMNFHETFSARVQKIIGMKVYHDDPKQHQQVVDDNQSLVSV